MNADTLLNELKARGVAITVDGDKLRLKGVPGSWDDLRDRVRAARETLVRLLKAARPWSEADWRALFEERAAFLEYEGDLTRKEAETTAIDHLVPEWSNRNPPPDPGGFACAHCSATTAETDAAINYGNDVVRWVHRHCLTAFRNDRHNEALAAVKAMGLLSQ